MHSKIVLVDGEFSAEKSQLCSHIKICDSDTLDIQVQASEHTKTFIQLVYFSSKAKAKNIKLSIDKGVHVHLFEQFDAVDHIDLKKVIFLGESASLLHEKIQKLDQQANYESKVNIFQDKNSCYDAVYISTGSKKAVENVFVCFEGEFASCDINGLCKANNDQNLSTKIAVDHKVPNCKSMQNFRGVVSGKATATFDSMAYVREGAQKSEAHQYFRNLLLDSTATVNANPQLEIYTDDVICSHGATVGQLNEDALFYLASRGIENEEAITMLMDAFTNEITDKLVGIAHE